MRKEIADMVFPVFRTAIEIRDRLRADEQGVNFDESQKKLVALLNAPVTENFKSDVMGNVGSLAGAMPANKLSDLGIRYALASWLDEIFILDTPWQDDWNINKMETTLFPGFNERAQEFWRQCQRAQNRRTRDTLEVYYLCVMLGFRGQPEPPPDDMAAWLVAWRDGVETQITQGDDREYSPPPPVAITPDVNRKLRGASLMQKWFMAIIFIGVMFIPLLVMLRQ